jgi:hypothetical protein
MYVCVTIHVICNNKLKELRAYCFYNLCALVILSSYENIGQDNAYGIIKVKYSHNFLDYYILVSWDGFDKKGKLLH